MFKSLEMITISTGDFMKSGARKLYRELAVAIFCTVMMSLTAFSQEVHAGEQVQQVQQVSADTVMAMAQMQLLQQMGTLSANAVTDLTAEELALYQQMANKAALSAMTEENQQAIKTEQTVEEPAISEPVAEAPVEENIEAGMEHIPEPVQTEQETTVTPPAEEVVQEPIPIPEAPTVLSANDFEILCRIVEAEATGGSVSSKRLVANVILNRVESGTFPNSISGVVFQKSNGRAQFSPISDGRYYRVHITNETVQAVNEALAGMDESQGALYFKATYARAGWFDRSLDKLYSYGGHDFYR